MKARLNSVLTPVLLSVIVVAVAVLTQWSPLSFQQQVTLMMVYCVAVVGLYVFVGVTGVQSFGHVAFMAVGAYVAGILAIPEVSKDFLLPDLPGPLNSIELTPFQGVIVGGVAAMLFAAVVAPLTRLNGISLSIALFAVLIIVNVVISEAESITRGTKSLSPLPLATTKENACAWAVGAIFFAYAYQRSRWGMRAMAAREDEYAAEAAGIRIPWTRSVALLLSALVMGAAGALYAFLLGSISPDTFFFDLTVLTLIMLIVGGVRSLTGAVIGTLVIFALSEFLRSIENGVDLGFVTVPERPGLTLIGVSLAALAILLWRPTGLTGGRELTLASFASVGRALAHPRDALRRAQESRSAD